MWEEMRMRASSFDGTKKTWEEEDRQKEEAGPGCNCRGGRPGGSSEVVDGSQLEQ